MGCNNHATKATVRHIIQLGVTSLCALFVGVFLFACSASVSINEAPTQAVDFLVGSYTTAPNKGIYWVSYNPQTQQLTKEKVLASAQNPSYLYWHKDNNMLYSIATENNSSPLLQVYQWEKTAQTFSLKHSQNVVGKGVCHVNVNHDQSQLALVNYSSGDTSLFTLDRHTHRPEKRAYFKNTGSGLTSRQKSSHLHYAGWGRQNRYLYMTDLGTDEVLVFDTSSEVFTPKHRVILDAGDGPRHLAFHPSKNLVYSVNELSNSITAWAQNPNTGALVFIEKTHIFADHIPKHASASAIHISNNGQHIYIAMRGENMIYGYSINDKGKLSFINKVTSGGDHPRDFNFSSGEHYLLVANQKSDQLSLLERNIATGVLSAKAISVKIEKPSYVQAF